MADLYCGYWFLFTCQAEVQSRIPRCQIQWVYDSYFLEILLQSAQNDLFNVCLLNEILCENYFGVTVGGKVLNIFSCLHGRAVPFCMLRVNIASPCSLDAGSLIHKCPRWFISQFSVACKQVMQFSL